MFWITLLSALLALTTACSTKNDESDFADIKVGTTKGKVLAVLGNPQRHYRRNSMDHWTYDIIHESGRVSKKVLIFQKGRVLQIRHKVPEGRPVDNDFKPVN